MNHAVTNWCKTFLCDTNAGLRSISQAASMGVQGDLMSNERWERDCMLQLQQFSSRPSLVRSVTVVLLSLVTGGKRG